MLRCLKRMKKSDETNPKLHSCLMKFLHRNSRETNMNEQMKTFINNELTSFNLNIDRDIQEMNEEFMRNHSNSLAHRVEGKYKHNCLILFTNFEIYVAAKVMLLLNPIDNLHAIEYLTKLDSNFSDQNLQVCEIFLIRFPYSTIFHLALLNNLRKSPSSHLRSNIFIDYRNISSQLLKSLATS